MGRKIGVLVIGLLVTVSVLAQDSVTYVVRDSLELKMDIYVAPEENRQPEVIMYLFGGAFFEGSRGDMSSICTEMSKRGFTCVAIDYRLRLLENRSGDTTYLKIPEFEEVIGSVVEDISSAVVYLKANGEKWGIDADKIVLAGSSAGAMSALQADWSLQNGYKWTKELPEGYRFAGIMSYAGAIFSTRGKMKYKNTPAPTMMYHGTKDMTVPYKKITFLNYYYGGANVIAKIFKKNGYSAKVVRVKGAKHEVCGYYDYYIDEAVDFIERFVRGGKTMYEDITIEKRQEEEKKEEKKVEEEEGKEKKKNILVISL